ncbi:MAG: polyprenyl synthetase family protein [Flavobacteriales bacterium]
MKNLAYFLEHFEKQLNAFPFVKNPENLYLPIDYIMKLGGKRIRPCMALLFAEAYGRSVEDAYPLANSIEIFHNFTLVHDDIMDEAPLRRGKETVHQKWDINTAILSGDSMMIVAYQELLKLKTDNLRGLLSYFNKAALLVCEGQQKDMDFEKETVVGLDEYLEMIKNKTAVLLAASMKLGAMLSSASENQLALIEDYGIKIGLAFQLRDDFLDVYGDDAVGKQTAGDILTNKKTALFLYALENASAKDKEILLNYYAHKTFDPKKKIADVLDIFNNCGVSEYINKFTDSLVKESDELVHKMDIDESYKTILIALNDKIVNRVY